MRVLIVDAHGIARNMLAMLLSQIPDAEVIGEVADGKLAVAMACATRPDVVLMDANIPVMDGIEATRHICAACPKVRVIGVSMHREAGRADAMLAAGATAYVSKSEGLDTLLNALRQFC